MYKKLISMLLILCLAFSIVGCSNRNPVSKNPSKETTTDVTIETTTTTENVPTKDNDDKTTEYDKTTEAEDNTTTSEDVTEDVTEPSGEGMTEPVTEPSTEAPTEKPTQPQTQTPTQKPTSAPTQAPTVAPTQPQTQAPTVPPTTQAPTEAPTINDMVYSEELAEVIKQDGGRLLAKDDPLYTQYAEDFAGFHLWKNADIPLMLYDGWIIQHCMRQNFVNGVLTQLSFYSIMGYVGTEANITVPVDLKIDGNPITKIEWSITNPNVTNIVIPQNSTVQSIIVNAEKMVNLKSIKVEDQLGYNKQWILGLTDFAFTEFETRTPDNYILVEVEEWMINNMTKHSSGTPESITHTLYKVHMDDGTIAYHHDGYGWDTNSRIGLNCQYHDKHLYVDCPQFKEKYHGSEFD